MPESPVSRPNTPSHTHHTHNAECSTHRAHTEHTQSTHAQPHLMQPPTPSCIRELTSVGDTVPTGGTGLPGEGPAVHGVGQVTDGAAAGGDEGRDDGFGPAAPKRAAPRKPVVVGDGGAAWRARQVGAAPEHASSLSSCSFALLFHRAGYDF